MASFFGAQNGNFHIAAGVFRVNADGIAGAVQQFQILSGIQTVIDEAGQVAVIAPGRNIQIGQQRGIIQGGSHLGNAALFHIVHSGIFRCHPVAAGFVQNGAEGKGFTGIQNGTVQRTAGQLQILVPAVVAGSPGLMLSQRVPEQGSVVQNFRRNVFHGDPQNFAVLGFGHQRGCFCQIEFISIGTGDGFEGLKIDGSIYRGNVEFLVNGFQINGIRFCGGFHIRYLHPELMEAVCVQNLFIDIPGIEADTRRAHDNDQGLGGCLLVELVCGQNGLIAFQAVAGLGQCASGILCVSRQGSENIVCIQLQVRQQGDVLGLLRRCQGKGCIHCCPDIQLRAGVLRRQDQLGGA